jgi:uncharacterized protein YbbC (DUF1343 family)
MTFIRLAFFLLLTLIQIDKLGAYELKNDLQAIPLVGAAQIEAYLPLLVNKRVGLVVNQTSRVGDQHLVDFLRAHQVDVHTIFAPEHGFRGDHDAGALVKNNIDQATGIEVISIYGKNKKPDIAITSQLDVIIFDIQDVGVRFYTFLSSMHYMMESAADVKAKFIVLDRPNPNIEFVDGPVLEPEFSSFVGMHPIPLLHGMTLAELAQMIKGEQWLSSQNDLDLQVVTIKNYTRTSRYSLPVKPSPNLPNDISINLYPSLGFFEATEISIGRGTDFPFQVIGHDKVAISDFEFMPISTPGSALTPKLMDTPLKGTDLRASTQRGLDLNYLMQWYLAFQPQAQAFFKYPGFMDKLAGTDKLRKSIEAGESVTKIKQAWSADIEKFKRLRQPYLIYR